MKIITDQDLNPNIIRYLEAVEDRDIFYKAYNLKHPLALYNTSFSKVITALEDFSDVYDNLILEDFTSNKNKNDKCVNLLKNYKTFLYSLREYLDDCFHIIKIFISPQSSFKKDRNQCNWLKKNALSETKDFFETIKDYKKYLDNIVNELKHQNGVLNYVVFYNERSGEFHMGYFVANVRNDAYEPVDHIHKRFQEQYTAFSFNRDVKYNLFNIFLISEGLVEFLEAMNLKTNFAGKITKKKSNKRESLYKKIMDMPRVFFPDEYSKNVPSVYLLKEGGLKLEYPSISLSLQKLTCGKMLLSHSGDGKTREFKVLYY